MKFRPFLGFRVAMNKDEDGEDDRNLPLFSSVLRLPCFSKQWLSIISRPNFRRLHSRRSASAAAATAVTGLLFPLPLHFVALQNEKWQQNTIANPLIELYDGKLLYNPTTNQRRRIPQLLSEKSKSVSSVAIAFDPSKSNHYKLVCVSF
nr:F-box protein At5g07610-like [Ipomoea batatas]